MVVAISSRGIPCSTGVLDEGLATRLRYVAALITAAAVAVPALSSAGVVVEVGVARPRRAWKSSPRLVPAMSGPPGRAWRGDHHDPGWAATRSTSARVSPGAERWVGRPPLALRSGPLGALRPPNDLRSDGAGRLLGGGLCPVGRNLTARRLSDISTGALYLPARSAWFTLSAVDWHSPGSKPFDGTRLRGQQ